MKLSEQDIQDFQTTVYDYYSAHKRPMPWRDDTSTYAVVVSELMLQQTQVSRVIEKFNEFTAAFSNFEQLAAASQADVLRLWSGLGYNRRALFLHRTAQKIMAEFDGQLPRRQKDLESLPGIGPNTAGAIRAYAFNDPAVFVETNIRAVYIEHFFRDSDSVSDVEILELVTATIDADSPREWYWALMDYGVYIKKTRSNPARRSSGHTKQSKFEGSRRQIRGRILKELATGAIRQDVLVSRLDDKRAQSVLDDLTKEALIFFDKDAKRYCLDEVIE